MKGIVVLREHCIGAGQCALNAPELFDQDDDGFVTVLLPSGQELPAGAEEVVRLCPSGALKLVKDDQPDPTGQYIRKDDA